MNDTSVENINRKDRGLALTIVLTLLVVAVMAIMGFLFLKPQPDTVQGQCDATEIRISGKLPGRVVEIFVEEGQRVAKGDTLVHIHSSIMEAKLAQASAMESAAAATNRKADAGTRPQIISTAYDLWQQAIAKRTITQKTYERMQNLFSKGVVSEQKRDEAKAAYDAVVAGENAAKSQYEMALEGTQSEDRQAAAAMVNAAKGNVQEVDAYMEDQYLMAPDDGEITEIYPNVSELVSMGTPIMSLQKDDKFAVFNVREDMLKDVSTGTEINVWIPALDIKTTMTVFYIKDLGSYANWQATKATGDYDARTFEMKARPKEKIENFRPGMSVVLMQK